MSAQAKTLEDLKDSRIMFDKEIPPFGYMLVLIVFFTMAGITVWSTFAHKAYMVRAEGSITSSDSNYVMPSFTGEIAKSYMEEGKLVQKGDVLFVVKSLDFDLQEEQLADSQENYEEQIAQYDKLIKSIKEDTNYFDAGENKDSLYYSMFENYKAQVAQNEVDTTMYKSYGYTDEQIESELVKAQSKKSELYYTALQTAENARKELENQLESAKAQLSAVGNGKNEYEVKASATGTLHLLSDYKTGMVVQTASPVATITPENADTVVDAYISTADMARIHEGDEVQIEVNGLSQTIYGNIAGRVQRIDSNVTTMEGGENRSSQVFKIRILPEMDYLVSKTGDKVNLSNGMTVEARIIYDKMTYFDYVLEKLGVKYK
ncbi:HlyD family efflux transporter periplasmic adaptor subunit [Roseburia sp. 1XD42-69]|uniref:HlyD family efflux transporter periplasmic adaptor subunit n=1 Tax=Roseburia sp. 1XD42-69 TaxID=2320088 RepID=UPI000EA0C347|nr:HlyD family efflux transporter periplasmic adaptor subunit [Roseburia sp. 1XD42-69]RKJ67898.1 HlyD family efflux transporter periplasmic adaptor subunit [Roseburia sp. 1XD42-69]